MRLPRSRALDEPGSPTGTNARDHRLLTSVHLIGFRERFELLRRGDLHRCEILLAFVAREHEHRGDPFGLESDQ